MIIITGSIAYDYIMDFPGKFGDHILPDQLHKINLSFLVNKFERRRGGTAGNASYSLGLLKTPHRLYSYIGKDGAEYLDGLKKVGIDITSIKIDKNTYTATGFAMTDKIDNQIWGFYTGASEKNPKLRLSSLVNKNDLVLVGPTGVKGTMNIVDQCIKLGVPYMFDPGFILTQVSDFELRKGILHAKYVIGNDYEIKLITDRIKTFELYSKKQTTIITMGKKGAVIYHQRKKLKIAPCPVVKIIDPTGAGDAWRSGFIAGLERGFDLKICGQMGSVAASYAIEQYGTQEHKYSLRAFEKRYFQTYNEMIHL